MVAILDGIKDEAEQQALDRALYRLADRQAADHLWRDYYHGDHRLVFATEKFRTTFGALFEAFADNLCPAVVDSLSDRLMIDAFSGDDANRERAWDVWTRNAMDRRAGEVHTETIRQGDSAVLVWSDDQGQAVLYPQRADLMTVEYDAEVPGQVVLAVKAWKVMTKPDGSGGRVRLNVYTSDRVLKYITKGPTANPRSALNAERWLVEGEAWPLTHDLGRVPVIPFANNAAFGQYGSSELRDVIPLQDALNKSVADMMVAMEFVAMPQRWGIGIEVPTDPETGKPVESWRPGVDRLWTTVATDAKFGEFPQADLGQFIRVQDNFRAEVARVSATPFHYLMLTAGEWPSGEAMKTAEARFVAKVRDRQMAFGQAWSEVIALALQVEGTADAYLEPDWREAAPQSEKDHLETLKIKSELGVPNTQLWKEMDYTEDQVAEMQAEKEANRATLADNMAGLLNAGG
jgi:hypothetical protein